MLDKIIEKYDVKKYYVYHEIPKNKNTVEFGWWEVEKLPESDMVVLSIWNKEPDKNSLVDFKDYQTYFEKLTSLSPKEFIEKWENHLEELKSYWVKQYPAADSEQHLFIMNIAKLIRDKKTFEMYGVLYRVVEINNENGDKKAEIQQKATTSD